MSRERQELVYAGLAGAAIALAYHLVKAHQAGDVWGAFQPALLPALGIGALAGVAAIWLRARAG